MVANLKDTVALKNVKGKYLKVTDSGALNFADSSLDTKAKFAVQETSNGKIELISEHTGKHVNMYYINDIKCEGPGGGLAMGIIYLAENMVCLTIAGYSGQDGRTAFFSDLPGDASYNGSLAVKDFPDDHTRFTVEHF